MNLSLSVPGTLTSRMIEVEVGGTVKISLDDFETRDLIDELRFRNCLTCIDTGAGQAEAAEWLRARGWETTPPAYEPSTAATVRSLEDYSTWRKLTKR